MTKWVEAVALEKANDQAMIDLDHLGEDSFNGFVSAFHLAIGLGMVG